MKKTKIQVFGRNNSKHAWAEYIDPGISKELVTENSAEIEFVSPFGETKVVISEVEE